MSVGTIQNWSHAISKPEELPRLYIGALCLAWQNLVMIKPGKQQISNSHKFFSVHFLSCQAVRETKKFEKHQKTQSQLTKHLYHIRYVNLNPTLNKTKSILGINNKQNLNPILSYKINKSKSVLVST